MIKKNNFWITVVAIIFLSGCIRLVTPVAIKTTMVERTATQTLNPTITFVPTLEPTQRPILTPSTAPEEVNLNINCLNIQPSLPSDVVYNGYLILGGDFPLLVSDPRCNVTLAMDMQTHEKIRLSPEEENFLYPISSSNRQWLAFDQFIYTDPQAENLVISDALGEKQVAIPWEENWLSPVSWLDNDRIVIRLFPEEEKNGLDLKFLVLNPFTGERQTLEPDYPDMYEQHAVVGVAWDGWGLTVYNTTLDRVVYPQGSDISSANYVLWDIQNHKSLVSIDLMMDYPNMIPRWSPSGDSFALAFSSFKSTDQGLGWPAFELYTIDRNGEVIQQTNLNAYYNWVSISDYSWSPDGNSIAFWFSAGNDRISPFDYYEEYLAVVNLENGEVTNYCIPGDYSIQIGSRSDWVPPPLWSPDGNQLVIVNRYDSDHHSRVILVDLETEQAYQIAENAKPMGWLLDAP